MRKRTGNKDRKILDAAIYIFAHKGFANTKISDIAAKAGIAVGSVYLYYPDKESILLKIMSNIWKDVYESLEMLYINSENNIKEKIFAFIELILRTLSENKEISLLISHEQNFWLMLKKGMFVEYYEKFFKLVVKMLKEGQEQKIVLDEFDPEVIATLLIGSIRYLVYTWQRGELNIDNEHLNTQIRKLLGYGIFV